ncbi:uncharacterized protein LOC123675053 isoform X2 [Harmonia axyridis]|nr:uncharacterized protein LOC123675053 isoform X2 [Harmonia axyridis]
MMVFCSTFLAAFAHTGSTLSVAMFILGSGLEANTHASRIHLAEILPKHTRGRHLMTPSFFWTLGYLFAIASAWKLSHHAVVDHRGSDMRLTAWRLMFAVAGGCNIIVACVTALVQPSPRYRLFRKQFDLAQSSLKLFYAINKSKYSETWPHREEDLKDIISDFQINTEPQPLNCGEQIRLLLRRMFKTVCLLFKRRFISTTVTLIIMRIFLFNGIVPVHLMLSKALMMRNETCEVIGHEILHLFPPVGQKCILVADMMLFVIFMFLALNILIGQIIVFITIDKLGRVFTLVVGLVTCSMSAYSISYWDMQLTFWIQGGFYVKCVLCSIFLGGFSVTLHVLDILEVEAYPTAARGAAAGVINFYPNFIFCVVCTLWYMPCQLTYIALGLTVSAAVVLTYFLPELKKHPMVE